MTKNEQRNEQKFLDALKAVFVGAKVEGESGYINLMKIKASYFEKGVFPQLKKDIDAACKPFVKEFREELFDRLYDFFSRYFSESGSIYFRHTAPHQSVYDKVYTDDQDVMLFWKTHMLYYVKTDRLFNSLQVQVEDTAFFFDVSGMQLKKSNEKRELVYAFKEFKEGVIHLKVSYSERGRKTATSEIEKVVKKNGITLEPETLEKAFRVFEKQSEVDYFINKNAKAFLQEQFDLWMYQYMFKGESQFNENRLKQLQVIKEIAFKIIEFIAQFEDELVKIWNKPKFVLNSNYVITIDRITDPGILEKVINHPGMTAQVQEWKELGMITDDFKVEMITQKDLTDVPLYGKYQYLPIDTKYFSDLKQEVLALFNDLDATLDGWLVHSENYQVLNSIINKFVNKVKCIYIDPPFNLGKNADFLYSVKYKDSTWITILENRINLAKYFINNDGLIFVRSDYNGNMFVRLLLNSIFGDDNFVNEIIVNRGKQRLGGTTKYSVATDSLYFYSKSKNPDFQRFQRERYAGEARSTNMLMRGDRKPPERTFIDPDGKKVVLLPPSHSHWKFIQSKIDDMYKKNIIYLAKSQKGLDSGIVKVENNEKIPVDFVPSYTFDDKKTIDSNWTDISGYSADWNFETENSEDLLERVLITATKEQDDIVMDFFLGSGTTIATAQKLGRRWIGIELGEQFSTNIMPRMKKVLFGEESGISKKHDWIGGGFLKYFDLEQYEDTLKRARYEDADLFTGTETAFTSYPFLKDLKMLDAVEIDKEKNEVQVNLEGLYPGIDLAETLSCLTGKWIKKITCKSVEFEDGSIVDLTEPRWEDVKPLIWW